jgi:Leucine-rich repeat (LRR) protein
MAAFQVLRVSGNDFSSWDSFAELKTLQELYINKNSLTKLKPVIKLFPKLDVLDVSENQVEDPQCVL